MTNILPNGKMTWGVLKSVVCELDGLLRVEISETVIYVDETLDEELKRSIGKPVVISHIFNKWRCGVQG